MMAHRGPDRHPPSRPPTPSLHLNGEPLPGAGPEHDSHNVVLPEPAPIDGPGLGPSPSQPGPSASTKPKTFEQYFRDCGKIHADANASQKFWGYGLLRKLLTRERVREELRKCDVAEGLCDKIVPDIPPGRNLHRRQSQPAYLAIFALLMLTGTTKDIESFLKRSELSDGQILFVHLDRITEVMDECGWGNLQRDAFELSRRGVMVPYFDTGEGEVVEVSPHQELQEGILLPWLKENTPGATASVSPWDKKGGFGSVTLHNIDTHSHSFKRLLDPVGLHSGLVAVKCLKPSDHPDKTAFHNEVNLLKRYGAQARQRAKNRHDRAHRHIITLLATYEQGGNYCFVFPAADCDLDEYITKKPGLFKAAPGGTTATIDEGTAKWLSEQIVGLVAAVNLMHGASSDSPDSLAAADSKFTRHGDLKLENILWFRSKTDENGILVVGDLGLADIHGEHSRSNVRNDKVPVTMTYRAPEWDIKDAKISRAYDIWTLGCVFLEIIAWALGGNAQRVKFAHERVKTASFARTNMYFDITRRSDTKYCFRVKVAVTQVRSMLTRRRGLRCPLTDAWLTRMSIDHRRAAQYEWMHGLHSCSSRYYQRNDVESRSRTPKTSRRASREIGRDPWQRKYRAGLSHQIGTRTARPRPQPRGSMGRR